MFFIEFFFCGQFNMTKTNILLLNSIAINLFE